MGRMSPATLENVVRKALRYAEGQVIFAFQGGEPTLVGTAFYEKLLELQKRYNTGGVRIQNVIQTNGYRLDSALLDLFAREKFLVGISLDGTAQLHDRLRVDAAGNGAAAAVEETIRQLQERNVDFNILCVVSRDIADHAAPVFRCLKKYGYLQYIPCLDPFDGSRSQHSLTPDAYGTFLRETFDLYYQEFRRGSFVSVRNFDNYLGILAGIPPENCAMRGQCAQNYLIEADGSVYPCDFYVLDQWRMGNINEDSFFKLEKSQVGAAFRRASHSLPSACHSCRWAFLCWGGCRRDREPILDGRPSDNHWCAAYQSFFAYSYPRMQEMAKTLYHR